MSCISHHLLLNNLVYTVHNNQQYIQHALTLGHAKFPNVIQMRISHFHNLLTKTYWWQDMVNGLCKHLRITVHTSLSLILEQKTQFEILRRGTVIC